jgi:predicted PurR-regulated permease PerM
MLTAKAQLRFFVFLALAVTALMFLIIRPYFSSVFLAIIFVIAFMPLHHFIRKILRGFDNLSALVSTVLVLLIIFIPVTVFAFLIFQEARGVYEEGLESGVTLGSIDGFIVSAEEKLLEIFPGSNIEIRSHMEVENLVQQGLRVVVDYFDKIFAGLLRLGIGAFLMVLATFYLFRDGRKMMDKIRDLSPLKGEYTDTIFSRIAEAINAVVRGRLLVGVIQGFVIGTGFAVFGLPSPILWGSIAAVASMLPVVGPLMIIIPTALILFFGGFIWSAIGIMAWGVIAVITVDEYLGSILIDQRMHIHPFLVLLSVMGGISFFGAIGFVVGPVVLALMFAILKIYPLITTPDAYETQNPAN